MKTSNPVPIGQHHLILVQEFGAPSREKIPAVYLQVNGQPIFFKSLAEYFLAYTNRSITWKKTTSRAVGLFWDYCQAHKDDSYIWGNTNAHRHIIRCFTLALLRGTIDTDTHTDPTALYWPPSSLSVVKRYTAALTHFLTWCQDEGIIENRIVNDNCPTSETTALSFLHTAIKIKSLSFLSHLKEVKTIASELEAKKRSQLIHLPNTNSFDLSADAGNTFPPHLIAPLLKYGFLLDEKADTPSDREDLTAKMITLLMIFGGTRVSEPFHLWFNDIRPEPDGTCKVFLRHPSEANTFLGGADNKRRKMYLAERGLTPRNFQGASKSYKAGWKQLKLDSSLSAPIFFIHSSAETLFREMYIFYLGYRQQIMSLRIQSGLSDHPFLFVSKGVDRNSDRNYCGEPYSISAYYNSLERALRRTEKAIGETIPRGKINGTTPHGFRHWYGRALATSGVDIKTIQSCLHHRSPLSQGIYTTPTHQTVTEQLSQARHNISINNDILFSGLREM